MKAEFDTIVRLHGEDGIVYVVVSLRGKEEVIAVEGWSPLSGP